MAGGLRAMMVLMVSLSQRACNADVAGVDASDAESLYKVLEEEVVPLYYDRAPRSAAQLDYYDEAAMQTLVLPITATEWLMSMLGRFTREIL